MCKSAHKNAYGKHQRPDNQGAFASDEVRRDSGSHDRKPENGAENSADYAKLRVGDTERNKVQFDLRKSRVVDLARRMLKE